MRTPLRDLVGSSFYNTEYWKNGNIYMLNSILSSSLSLMEFFDKLLFLGDSSRVIYASNAFAFRERSRSVKAENSDLQQLSLPFMNISLKQGGISLADTRLYSSYYSKLHGFYLPEIGKKAKLIPVLLNFEATFFTTQMADAHMAMMRLFETSATETLLAPSLFYQGQEIQNILVVNFDDISLDDQYQESDWLEKNRIHTISISISAYTYLVDFFPGVFTPEDGENGNNGLYWQVKEVILKWAERNNLGSWNGNDFDAYAVGVLNHDEETVEWESPVEQK